MIVESKTKNLNEPNKLKIFLAEFQKSEQWYMDSGCSVHVA